MIQQLNALTTMARRLSLKFDEPALEPRPRLEIAEIGAPETLEGAALLTLETVDKEARELEGELEALGSLPLNSEDVLLAVEADVEVGLTANVDKFKNRLEQASIDIHIGVAEALALEETMIWDPFKELRKLKSRIRETKKLVKTGDTTPEAGRRRERWLVEMHKAEYIRQQEAIRELQETLINAANDMLMTASGLTLRKLDEVYKDPAKAAELMDKAGIDNPVDLFVLTKDRANHDQLVNILEAGARRARLTEKQQGLFRQGLDEIFARHDKAAELIRKFGRGQELAAAMFRMKPEDIGEVEVLQGFGTLYFRFEKEESFARFVAAKFDPNEELTDAEQALARHAGGMSIGKAPKGLEDLGGGLIAEKTAGASYDQNRHLIKLHETQHALHRLYPDLDLRKSTLILQAIDENEKDNPDLDLIADAVESGARNQRISEVDPKAHDEILAYFTEGRNLGEIYNILTTSPFYDYYAQDKGGFQSTGSTLTSLDNDFRARIIDRVFGDEYYGEIYRGLRVIERMQELGMKNLEIRTALLTIPLVKWPTFLKRLEEQRLPERRGEPTYDFLSLHLVRFYKVIEQDIISLKAQSNKPELLEAYLQSAKKIKQAEDVLKAGKLEECIEILEEAIGEQTGGSGSILGWMEVRDFVGALYDLLDKRPGLPAYGFETDKMTPGPAIEAVLGLLHTTMREDDWWRIEHEASLHNYDKIKDELSDMAEVELSRAIKDKRAGRRRDQDLRHLRSALRALRP